MVAVSLMPPVDYCASCDGKKAEGKALDVARTREAEGFESRRTDDSNQVSPGALPPIAELDAKVQPVDTVARPLLSADLAVQASLAQSEIAPTDQEDSSTLRLQAIQAYAALTGR